jgi:hypothetical protein
MYKIATVGKKKVAIAQTGAGWNVSTYSVSGNRVTSYANKNTRTLANAKKEFTRQKKKLR